MASAFIPAGAGWLRRSVNPARDPACAPAPAQAAPDGTAAAIAARTTADPPATTRGQLNIGPPHSSRGPPPVSQKLYLSSTLGRHRQRKPLTHAAFPTERALAESAPAAAGWDSGVPSSSGTRDARRFASPVASSFHRADDGGEEERTLLTADRPRLPRHGQPGAARISPELTASRHAGGCPVECDLLSQARGPHMPYWSLEHNYSYVPDLGFLVGDGRMSE